MTTDYKYDRLELFVIYGGFTLAAALAVLGAYVGAIPS